MSVNTKRRWYSLSASRSLLSICYCSVAQRCLHRHRLSLVRLSNTYWEIRILKVRDAHLLGQIVVDDESVLAVVPEVFAHGAAGVWGQVLQRGGVRGGGADHDGVLHGIYKGKAFCRIHFLKKKKKDALRLSF